MAQKLTDMVIEEISLVDDPANEEARVLIVKAKSGEGQNGSGDGAPEADGLSANPDAAMLAAASLKEYQMDIENLSKALEDAEAKLAALEKRATEAEGALEDADAVIKAKDAEIEELTKAKTPEAPSEEEVLKGLPESIRKRIEESERVAKAAQDEITKMREEGELKDAIAKARTLNVGNAEEVGPLLMRVRKGMSTGADADALEALLRAVGEQSKVSYLFKSMGSDQSVDGDPEALIQAKADEIFKGGNGKLSREQAYAAAIDANPGLYGAYIAKRRAK